MAKSVKYSENAQDWKPSFWWTGAIRIVWNTHLILFYVEIRNLHS